MEHDEQLEKIREYARTTVLEPEEEPKEHSKDESMKKLNLFSKIVMANTAIFPQEETSAKPQETVEQQVLPEEKPTPKDNSGLDKIKEHIRASQLNDAKKQAEEKVEAKQEIKEEVKQEEQVEQQVESLYSSSLSIESTNDEELDEEINSYTKANSKSYKFRIRLLTGVFCCLFAILSGWIIGNIVEISSTSSKIASVTEANIDLKDLIKNISKTDPNKKPADPEDGTLFPIEEIIPITPLPKEDPTSYEKESNWFDKICNWFNNIFGG